jgi:hypothetical protein
MRLKDYLNTVKDLQLEIEGVNITFLKQSVNIYLYTYFSQLQFCEDLHSHSWLQFP